MLTSVNLPDASTDDEDDDTSGKKKPTGAKNQEQLDRRRERNRVLARKTRLRKKFFFESLQKQVSQLAAENDLLKNVIRQRLSGDIRSQVLAQCKSTDIPPIIANSASSATSMLEKVSCHAVMVSTIADVSFIIGGFWPREGYSSSSTFFCNHRSRSSR